MEIDNKLMLCAVERDHLLRQNHNLKLIIICGVVYMLYKKGQTKDGH